MTRFEFLAVWLVCLLGGWALIMGVGYMVWRYG